jgi:hypothetical protein
VRNVLLAAFVVGGRDGPGGVREFNDGQRRSVLWVLGWFVLGETEAQERGLGTPL